MNEQFAKRHPASKHFAERCRERGIVSSNIDEVYQGVSWARANGRDDLAEKVLTHNGAEYYRFSVAEGMFYAVFPKGWGFPATVYGQDVFRKKRWAAKQAKRGGRSVVRVGSARRNS